MSKEKLKEIIDIYGVDAHEYIRELGFLTSDVDELMSLTYNQAIEDAADSSEVEYSYETSSVTVHKQSILKLKI